MKPPVDPLSDIELQTLHRVGRGDHNSYKLDEDALDTLQDKRMIKLVCVGGVGGGGSWFEATRRGRKVLRLSATPTTF